MRFACKPPFLIAFCALFLFLIFLSDGNFLRAQTTIACHVYQTKSACSQSNAKISVQLFIVNPNQTTEFYKLKLKQNSIVIDSTTGSSSSLSTMPSSSLLGNTAVGKWDSFTNVQSGFYEIIAEITTGSTLGASDSDTLTITNHLPYSVYYNSANDSANNNGDSILHLDFKTDFCAEGNGSTNDVLSGYFASNFINQRLGKVDLYIPSGIYLVNIQDTSISYPSKIVFSFSECTNMSITGALDSVGSPTSIFKFAGGQKYGCFDANNAPIICDPSIDPANPGTLLNFTKCENIILSNIKGDGNNSNMIFGGSNNGGVPNGLGDSINDIQVAASGLRIDGYNKNFIVSDCNFNHFCLDGITINGEIAVDTISGTVFPNFLTKDQSAGLAYNLFQNIDCNNNSRIGISISAGKYIKLLECDIYNTGQGTDTSGKPLANAPATGIDIEPNGYLPPNAPLDGCSQIVIEECNVKYSYAHALTILSIIHPSNPNADFVSQWITSKNSYYADYDDISLQIAWSPGTQATVESNGLNVTFEGDTIVGSFWRGCYPNSALDQPKFSKVTFLEDDGLGPLLISGNHQYQNYNKLFYSHNHCQQMFFDECTFTVNHAKSPIYLFTRDAANVDTSKYALFKDCTFNYENNHVENYNNTLNGIVFVGCKFQGKTTFNNNTSEVKNIKAAGVILNGSIDPCTPSLFKLDKNMIFTYNNSHSYYDYNAGTGQTILVTASVNKPLHIGPPTINNSSTYANFEIPDSSTFRSSIYENYNLAGNSSTSPPEIYIGEKSRFLMYSTTGVTQFLAHLGTTVPSLVLKNEGQFILADSVNVAVFNLSIQNPNNTNITYFAPGVVKPTWWTNSNNINNSASGSNCYYIPPSVNPPLTFTNSSSTNYDQIKWDEKFTVYYKIQNNPCASNSLGSIQYLVKGGTGNYIINIDGNTSTSNNVSLATGTHTFTVTDSLNTSCSFSFQFTITEPPALSWSSIQTTNPNCTPGNNGIIIPLTTGGTGQVSFTPSVLTGLSAGTFPITATDANGCSISTSVTLYQPNSNHCCSTTSNPNAGSNIASQPNIILLPNTQVSNLTAINLLANYGSSGVIQGKKFYIDGILNIDDNITFNQCDIYFTTGSKLTVNAGKNLHIVQNSTLQASCAMWDGIYASNASSQIQVDNSTLKDMENGIVSTNGAKLTIVGNQFIDNYSSLQIIQAPVGFNNTNGSCQIQGNTFSGSGNPLRAPHASQSKPELGIRLSKCSEVEIGVLGSTTLKNTFTQLYTGIFIEPGAQNQAHNLKIYNNLFENIKDDIQPGGAYYSTLIGNTYNTHRGAGIYAVPYSVAPLNITNLHRIVVNGNQNLVSFSNCDKAIVTSYFGANIQNIQTSGTPLGFMFGNADGQYIEAGNVISQIGGGQHNILNGVMIGIQVLGNTSKTFINDNEINLSGDYYLNGPISTLYYWAQGIILRPFNSPTTPYEINQNQINIPNLGGTGISISNAGKGLRVFNNEIRFQTTSAAPDNSCAWCRSELVGIEMSNSRDGMLEANKVYGFTDASGQPLVNVFNERNAFALRMFHSRDIGLKCNETHKTRYGFYVVGDCSHADPLTVRGNLFDYHVSGMLFNHLGSEGTFGNIGAGNHDNNNQFSNSSQAIGNTYLREIFRITNSNSFLGQIFTLQIIQGQSTSTVDTPGLTSFGAYKISANNPFHYLLTCEDLPIEINEESLTSGQIVEALRVAGDSINYPEYTDLSEWYDERRVYEWLRRDSVARATYPLLNAFYANQESLLTDEIRTLDMNMHFLCQENTLNDSTIFQNLIQEITQENIALPIGRLFENYEKDLNRIYLDVLTHGWQNLTTADFEELEELALSCPFVNGSAVYKARSLYAHIQPGLSYNDLEICNAVGVYKNVRSDNSENDLFGDSFEILIYPNPATDRLNIQTSLDHKQMNIRLFDMTGNKVKDVCLPVHDGKTELEVSSLHQGMYNLQIIIGDQKRHTKFIKL